MQKSCMAPRGPESRFVTAFPTEQAQQALVRSATKLHRHATFLWFAMSLVTARLVCAWFICSLGDRRWRAPGSSDSFQMEQGYQEDVMLVLSRKLGESIQIGSNVRAVVVSVTNGRAKLGIDAPDHIRILRTELVEREVSIVGSDQVASLTSDGVTSPAPR
jgi:carbon storage regulator